MNLTWRQHSACRGLDPEIFYPNTDEEAAASAIDLRTGATGIVRHARGTRETLVLDRVRKQDVVRRGNEIVTAGWRALAASRN